MAGEENKGKEWYSNKDLYEMIDSLKAELGRTLVAVREYNGLRECVNDALKRVEAIEQQALGRYSVGKAIREWGGWVLAIVAFLYAVLK